MVSAASGNWSKGNSAVVVGFQVHPPFTLFANTPSGRSKAWMPSASVDDDNAECNVEYEGDNCLYDYDELLASDLEKNRLQNMYTRFDYDNWLQHRASDRFYRNLLQDFFTSPIIASLLDEVLLLMVVSAGVIAWNALFVTGYTDFGGIYHESPIFTSAEGPWKIFENFELALPIQPFLICGGPLGLLLVFRNDASFTRYNEGFHHWEKISSNFMNMMLMASNAIGGGSGESKKVPPKEEQVAMVKHLGVTSWALMRTLKHELSGRLDPVSAYEKDVKAGYETLTKSRPTKLLSSSNKLFRAQYDIHQAIEPMTPYISLLDKRALINSVNDVALQCVNCERLYTTPIPLLYTRHTLKFLTIWLSLMPFALYDVFEDSWNHTLMIPCVAILAFLFFGIEEIAVYLEEPFSILPLDEMVEEVYSSINDVSLWMVESEEGDE